MPPSPLLKTHHMHNGFQTVGQYVSPCRSESSGPEDTWKVNVFHRKKAESSGHEDAVLYGEICQPYKPRFHCGNLDTVVFSGFAIFQIQLQYTIGIHPIYSTDILPLESVGSPF